MFYLFFKEVITEFSGIVGSVRGFQTLSGHTGGVTCVVQREARQYAESVGVNRRSAYTGVWNSIPKSY
jgi:hypothetical protein